MVQVDEDGVVSVERLPLMGLGRILNTRTKKALLGAALFLFVWEVVSIVVGDAQLITEAMAELACQRPWIPYWLASLLVHLFFPRRYSRETDVSLTAFLGGSMAGTVLWELFIAFSAGDNMVELWFCRHMWVSGLAGAVAGHLGFPRPLLEQER